MKTLIKWCPACSLYTLKGFCPKCNERTANSEPPKYSPEDKYGAYRRMDKETETIKHA